GAIRRVMFSPCLSVCRPLLFEPSCARYGVSPLLRWGYWFTPDRNGVVTFHIGKLCRVSCPLYAGSWAPSQRNRKTLLTFASARTYQPLSSPLCVTTFRSRLHLCSTHYRLPLA